MKEIYETAEMDLIFFESEDAICASIGLCVETEENELIGIPATSLPSTPPIPSGQ